MIKFLFLFGFFFIWFNQINNNKKKFIYNYLNFFSFHKKLFNNCIFHLFKYVLIIILIISIQGIKIYLLLFYLLFFVIF